MASSRTSSDGLPKRLPPGKPRPTSPLPMMRSRVPTPAKAPTKAPPLPKAPRPAAALIGALLCTVCDLAARLLFAPYELPVGVLLSLLGVPFFLILLLSQKRRNRHDLA